MWRLLLPLLAGALGSLGCPGGAGQLVTHEGSTQMNESTLRFSIAGPEQVKPREAVTIDLGLANRGAEPVLANGRFVVDEADGLAGHFEVSFAITDPSGEPLGFLVDVDGFEASASDLVMIPPGGEHLSRVRLDRYFMLSEPGAYRIAATYRNTLPLARDGRRAFVGSLDAEPITITVAP